MDWIIPEELKKGVSYARFELDSIDREVICQTQVAGISVNYRGKGNADHSQTGYMVGLAPLGECLKKMK